MKKLRVGEKAPDFKLPGVDGKNHSLVGESNGSKAIVIVFMCNHCPYSQAYEDRVMAIQKDYARKQVRVIAINPNDATAYPEDSFEKMKQRAAKRGLSYLYLRDELQLAAKSYGAEYTPEAYLLDHAYMLRYNGRIDDNWQNPSGAKVHDLRKALDEVLAGKSVSNPMSHAIGCSVKWKF